MIVTPKYYYTKMAPEPEALWYEDCQRVFSEIPILRTHTTYFQDSIFVHNGSAVAEKYGQHWRPLREGEVFDTFEILDAIVAVDRTYPIEQYGVRERREGCLEHTAYFYENRGFTPEKQMPSNRRYHYLKNLKRSQATFEVGETSPRSWVYEMIKGRLFSPAFNNALHLAHQAFEFLRLDTELKDCPKVVLQDQNGGFSIWYREPGLWRYAILYQPPGFSLGRKHVDEFIRRHLPLGEKVLLHVESLFGLNKYAHYKKDAANIKEKVHHLYACPQGSDAHPPYFDLDTDQAVEKADET